MTQSEYNHILHFCKVNGLPKPQRYPVTGKEGQYVAKFNANRMRGAFKSYEGAMNYCLAMLNEKKESGWGL